ncbi:receptor-like serine/threonine-protein kinase SD1-8 [Dioscorea cayenensis subsp. rotundata]|uniref:Receptor-like serine/threonine-protein kinase n=1 Tax=Dioscorea cayennensis subsp. rotundata TaxID=55577 RepID=A0AB40CIX6_DIOCR|nr:receptor-like serine/threonine-protein kinase SD1-8 [Dioscorea cayenensis subsp. rotundata]
MPLLFVLLFMSFSHAVGRDTITPAQPLTSNETLISSNEKFALGFFKPVNSNKSYVGLWYNKISKRTIVWVANRKDPVTTSTGTLSISDNGSLLITDQNSTVVWSSGVANVTNPVAQLLNTGNLVVREDEGDDGNYSWQGFDYPTDTLIAGMKVGVDFVKGLNRTMTAWTSDSDPSPSQYYAMMDIHGDPQLLLCAGSKKLGRTGPWNGYQFTGLPTSATRTYTGFDVSFINNKQEITYSFNTNLPILSKMTVNQSGLVQRSIWEESSGFWNEIWHAPVDQCDSIQACGPFTICNPNNLPICDCLQGFTPKSPEKWYYTDASDGCVRKTQLDCKDGTDGFLVIPYTKLADTTKANVDTSLSLEECRTKCLNNCTCTAYAPSTDVDNGKSGCITWTDELRDVKLFTNDAHVQDFYVRIAAADLDSAPSAFSKSRKWVIPFVIIFVVTMLILAFVGYIVWKRRKTRRARAIQESKNSFHDPGSRGLAARNALELSQGSDLELPLLDLGTIASATENFSADNKLGEGGFGPVYKGMLEDGKEIAVKRLAKTSSQGLVEFKNEVLLIAKLQHRNLVRLLACCIEAEERILVYEYMPNKSLDFFLFAKSKDEVLNWQTRFKIIMGIARGLLYLHQDSRLRVIHRDLKASNILLDKEMNPKISDFGMARIFGGDEAEGNTKKVVGTYGYMSPEYAMDGIFSQKSDAFSFGVLVLEIISGKKNKGVYSAAPHKNLLDHVWSLFKEGNNLQIVDESLGSSYDVNEVMRCINVGLLCVQDHPGDRPLMSSVLLMLGSDRAILPYPKEPGFSVRNVSYQMESGSSKASSSAACDTSATLIEPR